MNATASLKYTATHEWVRLSGTKAVVGITDHAQKEISDVVFVELPKIGRQLKLKESAMVVESVKAAFDIYAPISGTVAKVNEALKQNPGLINQSPYDKGWLFELEGVDSKELDSLMDEKQYLSLDKSTH